MNYLSINDVDSLNHWVEDARSLKENPLEHKQLGADLTIGLLFFNPSLRTRGFRLL